ncbi:MAG: hypothetical protein LBR15_03585 [Methanobrevibacter sp.]|jgi:hypothetical protein|nr:hypothetical protein [Candidatus Methanovirga australis]
MKYKPSLEWELQQDSSGSSGSYSEGEEYQWILDAISRIHIEDFIIDFHSPTINYKATLTTEKNTMDHLFNMIMKNIKLIKDDIVFDFLQKLLFMDYGEDDDPELNFLIRCRFTTPILRIYYKMLRSGLILDIGMIISTIYDIFQCISYLDDKPEFLLVALRVINYIGILKDKKGNILYDLSCMYNHVISRSNVILNFISSNELFSYKFKSYTIDTSYFYQDYIENNHYYLMTTDQLKDCYKDQPFILLWAEIFNFYTVNLQDDDTILQECDKFINGGSQFLCQITIDILTHLYNRIGEYQPDIILSILNHNIDEPFPIPLPLPVIFVSALLKINDFRDESMNLIYRIVSKLSSMPIISYSILDFIYVMVRYEYPPIINKLLEWHVLDLLSEMFKTKTLLSKELTLIGKIISIVATIPDTNGLATRSLRKCCYLQSLIRYDKENCFLEFMLNFLLSNQDYETLLQRLYFVLYGDSIPYNVNVQTTDLTDIVNWGTFSQIIYYIEKSGDERTMDFLNKIKELINSVPQLIPLIPKEFDAVIYRDQKTYEIIKQMQENGLRIGDFDIDIDELNMNLIQKYYKDQGWTKEDFDKDMENHISVI